MEKYWMLLITLIIFPIILYFITKYSLKRLDKDLIKKHQLKIEKDYYSRQFDTQHTINIENDLNKDNLLKEKEIKRLNQESTTNNNELLSALNTLTREIKEYSNSKLPKSL